MINFHRKICTRIYNFFVLLFHAYRFAVSGYSLAKPKFLKSSLINGVSFIFFMNRLDIYVHIAFQKRIRVF